jgi:hypothetical protein
MSPAAVSAPISYRGEFGIEFANNRRTATAPDI